LTKGDPRQMMKLN